MLSCIHSRCSCGFLCFPTRRSSDLLMLVTGGQGTTTWTVQRGFGGTAIQTHAVGSAVLLPGDRKSTRLNSSHLVISYAVFCLNKTSVVANLHGLYVHCTK